MFLSPQKIIDFAFIIASAFIVAFAGKYFFDWNFEFGVTLGILLGVWTTLYDVGVQVLQVLGGDDEEDDEDEEGIAEEITRRIKKK